MNRDRYLIILSVLYFAILGCFLLGCSEGTNSSPVSALMGSIDSSTSTNKVSGLVLDSSTNTGLPNIYVQLYGVNGFVKGELTATDGSFTFSELEPGTYSVNIVKEGYEPPERPTVECYVNNGSVYENYILYLKATTTNTSSQDVYTDITGQVKRSDGSSAANTPIILSLDKNGSSIVGNENLVMGDGSFSFFNVLAGKTYFIIVGEASSNERTIYPIGIDNKGKISPANIIITVNVVNQATTINSLTFRVTSAYTGAALELATIKINGENIGTTNINGEITINNLSTGLSTIEVTKEGFETLTSSKNFIISDNRTTIPLTMVEDTKDGYGSITGRYVNLSTSEGVGNLYVRLYRLIQRTQTDSNNNTNKTETWYDVDKDFILTTRSSNGSGSNGLEGSFKLTHIEPGYYQLYIGSTTDIPETEQRSQVYPNFEWTQLKTNTNGHVIISQPFEVVDNQTTYWTNYEQGNN